MKSIAILGRPNVGKSSLFNRLAKEQIAITSPISGTTRDIKEARIAISGVDVALLDTGGIDFTHKSNTKEKLESSEAKAHLFDKISQNALNAGAKADLVLYMVDGSLPPQSEDISQFRSLQKRKTPLMLVINKVDNDSIKQRAYEFVAFGVRELHFISILNNKGITKLLNAIFATLQLESSLTLEQELRAQMAGDKLDSSLEAFLASVESMQTQESKTDEAISVGIIGRVNVGKSSLLNALLNKERSIVSAMAGSTTDPVSDTLSHKDKCIKFIDTAGIRRSSKIEGIEKFALERTNRVLAQSHIAILVLDVESGFVELDEKISSLIPRYALGVIIVLNKWDRKYGDFKQIMADVKRRFSFLAFAPIITLSALNGRNIEKLKDSILQVYERFCFRIPTSALNEIIAKATAAHHLPSDKGKIVKIYYATQYATKPPQIAIISNKASAIHFSYKRYLINCVREAFDFSGVPIFMESRDKSRASESAESVDSSKKPKRTKPSKASKDKVVKNTRFA